MRDGIENAGWGTHDATAHKWVDLINPQTNHNLIGGAYFDTNHLVCNAITDGCHTDTWNYSTIEVVVARHGGVYGIAIPFQPVRNVHNVIFVEGHGYCGNDSGKQVQFSDYTIPHHVAYTFGDAYIAYGDGRDVNYGNYDDWWGGIGGINGAGTRGSIADYYCLRLYSRALTAAEIAANYAVDKERFNLPS